MYGVSMVYPVFVMFVGEQLGIVNAGVMYCYMVNVSLKEFASVFFQGLTVMKIVRVRMYSVHRSYMVYTGVRIHAVCVLAYRV